MDIGLPKQFLSLNILSLSIMFLHLNIKTKNNGEKSMRALSPILSAVILIMATVAAGIIVYQYFIGTVKGMTTKPMVYVNNAQYMDSIKRIFVTIYNSGPKTITIQSANIICKNNAELTINTTATIGVGQSKTLSLPLTNETCTPIYIILNYKDSTGKTFSTSPIEIA